MRRCEGLLGRKSAGSVFFLLVGDGKLKLQINIPLCCVLLSGGGGV